uniref:DUF5723 family protein n=1 Tax=Roseihalotalea indica TaxID=2867963 RepID=A0AA49GIL3_9BACT|nr:DUF5723 family protein [Tunicatimonas sp. TK19036]
MKYIYSLIALILLAASSSQLYAQQELTLHLLNNVYQSSHTNPAFVPRNKVHVSLLSSYHLSLKNSGFTYNQIAANIEEDETGQRVLDLEKLYNNLNLNGNDYIHFSADIDLFALSFKAAKNRFSLNVTEHIQGRQRYDGSIFQIAIEGNEPGQTLEFGKFESDAIHYREIGIGFNRPFLADDKLVLGTRVKALFGLANVQTKHADVSLFTATEQDLYALTANANILVNTSGTTMLEDDETSYITNTKNGGFGIDLGGTYQLNDQISFAASVVNLGFINWKEDTKAHSSNGSFTFTGIENEDLLTGGGFDIDVEQLTDSISNIFELEEEATAYTTGLPTQVYLTGNYQLATNTTASATLYSDFYQSFRRGFSLGIRQNVGRWLQAAATYSIQSRSYNNLGLGLAMTTGPKGLQLYFATDNIVALAAVGNAKVVNLRTGFNFVF